MNKLVVIAVCIVLCGILFSSCSSDNNGKATEGFVGMSYAEFCERIPEEQRSEYYSFVFFSNANGNLCAARFETTIENQYAIVECYTYSKNKFDTSAESFSEIKPGMSIFEVVERVGFPTGTATFGLATLVFLGDAGECVVVLDANSGNTTVAEVNFR